MSSVQQQIADLQAQISQLAKTEEAKSAVKPVAYGSSEHEQLIKTGYKMSRKEAEETIAQRAKDVNTVGLEEYHVARELVHALTVKPTVTSQFAQPMSVR